MSPYGIIYSLRNRETGMEYIGKTTRSLQRRVTEHAVAARNRGGCVRLHRAIAKHGIAAFDASVICEASSRQQLDEMERLHIAKRGTLSPGGYNLTAGGDGGAMPPHICERIAAKKRGKKQNPESVRRRALANTGKVRSPETGRKISAVLKGRSYGKGVSHGPMPQETKDKLSLIFKGKPQPKNRRPSPLKGKSRPPFSAEWRRKISLGGMGRPAWNKGKPCTWKPALTWNVTFPDGHSEVIVNLSAFCRAHNLSHAHLGATASGKRAHHKGFRCTISSPLE